MTEIIETTGENLSPEQSTGAELSPAEALATAVIIACGKDGKGDLTARPMMTPELLAAEAPLIREAIRSTMQRSWKKQLPALDERLETLDENDLRMLLIFASCYFCLGRMQGMLEERLNAATGETVNG